jgi:hypothetical protein
MYRGHSCGWENIAASAATATRRVRTAASSLSVPNPSARIGVKRARRGSCSVAHAVTQFPGGLRCETVDVKGQEATSEVGLLSAAALAVQADPTLNEQPEQLAA